MQYIVHTGGSYQAQDDLQESVIRIQLIMKVIAHERLAIVDPDSGDQPLYNESRDLVLGVWPDRPPLFAINVRNIAADP